MITMGRLRAGGGGSGRTTTVKSASLLLSPSSIHFLSDAQTDLLSKVLSTDLERNITDVTRRIAAGASGDCPKIQAVQKDGHWFTLNNSQLALCRRLELEGCCRQVKVDVVSLTEVPVQLRGMMVVPEATTAGAVSSTTSGGSTGSAGTTAAAAVYTGTTTTAAAGVKPTAASKPSLQSLACGSKHKDTRQFRKITATANSTHSQDLFKLTDQREFTKMTAGGGSTATQTTNDPTSDQAGSRDEVRSANGKPLVPGQGVNDGGKTPGQIGVTGACSGDQNQEVQASVLQGDQDMGRSTGKGYQKLETAEPSDKPPTKPPPADKDELKGDHDETSDESDNSDDDDSDSECDWSQDEADSSDGNSSEEDHSTDDERECLL